MLNATINGIPVFSINAFEILEVVCSAFKISRFIGDNLKLPFLSFLI